MKVFAENFEQTDEGLVKFPQSDSKWRMEMFIEEAVQHPAKYNLYLIDEVIKYVSEPGESIMDVMAGTGSTMIGALQYRFIHLVEIEPRFASWIWMSREKMKVYQAAHPDLCQADLNDIVKIYNAPCQDVLPIPVNHIIFSPPYGQHRLGSTPKMENESTRVLAGPYKDSINFYQDSQRNVGNKSLFFYNREMSQIYRKCVQSILPGGTLTVIIKDYIDKQERVDIHSNVTKTVEEAGMPLWEWYKWAAMGSRVSQAVEEQRDGNGRRRRCVDISKTCEQ